MSARRAGVRVKVAAKAAAKAAVGASGAHPHPSGAEGRRVVAVMA